MLSLTVSIMVRMKSTSSMPTSFASPQHQPAFHESLNALRIQRHEPFSLSKHIESRVVVEVAVRPTEPMHVDEQRRWVLRPYVEGMWVNQQRSMPSCSMHSSNNEVSFGGTGVILRKGAVPRRCNR